MARVLLTNPDYCGTLAAARALGRAGHEVWMAGDSRSAMAMHSRFVTRKVDCPSMHDPEAWREWLVQFGAEHPGLVLSPTSDDVAWLMASVADRLAANYRMWTPSIEVYEELLDKAILHRACARVGLEVPPTAMPENEEELERAVAEVELPVLLKQRTQVLSPTNHKGVIVRERRELAAAFRAFREGNPHHALVDARVSKASWPLLQHFFQEGVSGSLQVSGFIDETGQLFVARGPQAPAAPQDAGHLAVSRGVPARPRARREGAPALPRGRLLRGVRHRVPAGRRAAAADRLQPALLPLHGARHRAGHAPARDDAARVAR